MTTIQTQPVEGETLLMPREVAAMFRVDTKTVLRWAHDGKLPSVRTLGGHHRFPAAAVHELLTFEDAA